MGGWLTIESVERRAYLARPERGSGPGVLVLHAWWGLTEVFTGVCDRLAAAGFVALAPSLYAGNATAATIPEAEALAGALQREPDAVEGIALAAIDELRDLAAVTGERIGVIGFSLGAYWAFHLSQVRPDEIGAVVAVYGANDGDFSAARAAYLVHLAEHDEYEPIEYVRLTEEKIRAAGRDATFHVYPGTRHWFVEPNRPDVYDPAAAALVWQRTIAFFRDQLG